MNRIFSFIVCVLTFTNVFSQVPGACGKITNPIPFNGNNSLGSAYSNIACGLNYVYDSAHIETRYFQATGTFPGCGGSCSWNISGLPPCYVIDKAYVWALCSYVSATPPTGSVTITNPAANTSTYAPATGGPIGTSGSKCWSETGSATYRYDVTASISGNGAYSFSFPGFTGTPSGNFTNSYDQIDGATLMIIYKDPNATYQGTMNIWDGAIEQSGPSSTSTMTGLNVCAVPSLAKAFTISSDHQPNVGPTHSVTLNGVASNFPNIFYDEDEGPVTLTAGQTTSNFGMDGSGGSDCYLWGVMGLYYQTNCAVCTPSAVSLTVTPTNSTCNAPNGGATAVASGTSPPFTYLWSPSGATTTSISGLTAGNYSCTVTNASGCSTLQTFTITTSAGPNVTFTATPTKCNGSSNGSATVTASGGTGPYTYGWITNPVQNTSTANGLSAGTYSVTVGDATGCSATYTVAVTEPTALAATASVVANVSCNGGSNASAISNASGGTIPYSYVWTPSGQNTQTASGLSAGTFSVVVTDSNGCTAAQSVNITQPPPILLTQTTTVASCGVANGSASVNPSGGAAPYTYLWLTSPVQNTQTINNIAGGTYNVLVTDANGCTQQMSIIVQQTSPPTAAFTNNPDTVNLLDAIIYFTDQSNNAATWYWNFGDPNDPTSSNIQNPSHTYSDTGVYCITLVVTDPGGICIDSIVHCIDVEAPYTFYVPNAFTPNGDGFNEMFNGQGTYIKTFHIIIFDRWGNKIFESNDINKGWDGKVQNGSSGNQVQEDVYVWKIDILDDNNKTHKYIGRVTMVK